MLNIVNLTKTDITLICGEDNSTNIVIKASESPVNIETIEQVIENNKLPVPLVNHKFGEIENLPEIKENTIYIVSSIAAQAIKEKYPERTDILILSGYVRDENGKIIGATKLAKL